MQKRHIKIEMVLLIQSLQMIKKHIKNTLSTDLRRKCATHSNTASSLIKLKENLDSWLDQDGQVLGDTMLITGNLEPELNQAYAVLFAASYDLNEVNFENDFTPRISLATASCIGAGLDSNDVFSVMRLGLPPSKLDFMQEMGKCSCGRTRNHVGPSDAFTVIFNLNDHICMVQRVFAEEKEKKESPGLAKLCNLVIDKEAHKKSQFQNLQEVLQSLVLNKGKCIHTKIEHSCSSPMEPLSSAVCDDNCVTSCPVCDRSVKNFILPIKKEGMKDFLANTFIALPPSGTTYAVDILSSLQHFLNAGQKIYSRKKVQMLQMQNSCMQLSHSS